MTEPAAARAEPDPAPGTDPAEPGTPAAAEPATREDSFWLFCLKLVLVVVLFRSFVFSPFNIPSESMLPRMWTGDYLLAAKWPYGFTRYSLPLSVPLIPGRLFADQPDRGDIVIFKAPPLAQQDYVKRVIGLPGDTVELRGGQVILNGTPVPKAKVADFIIPVTQNMVDAQVAGSRPSPCAYPRFEARGGSGAAVCRYPQFEETLPEGRRYRVLDFGRTPQDDFGPVIVPEGRLFLMGDNRDNSEDSRFAAVPGGGIGMVPQENLVGRATVMMWSTDGSAGILPWTWFTAARWNRIGHLF